MDNSDMEKVTVITNPLNEHLVLDKYALFEYKCEEKQVIGRKIQFVFSRDDSAPYIEDLRKLEKEFGEYKIRPMWLTIVSPIISFMLFSVFLVLFISMGKSFNMNVYFPGLLIPAIVFLLVGVLVMVLRGKALQKIDSEKPLKEQEYREKIRKFKEGK